MADLFENLDWADGKSNPSGIVGARIFWVLKRDLVSYPSVIDAPASAVDTVTLDGSFVLKTGKKWKTLYSTQGKATCTFEPTGEKDAKLFLLKASLKYPDISPEAKAMAKGTINSDVIFCIQEPTEDERWSIVGDKRYQMDVNPSGSLGEGPGSEKGLTLAPEVYSTLPLPMYKGTIQFTDEDDVDQEIDCSTGIITEVIAS